MSHTYLNQVRKELVRNSLGYPIAKFCTWDTPVGASVLFEGLPKMLKDREESYLKLRRRSRYRWASYFMYFRKCYNNELLVFTVTCGVFSRGNGGYQPYRGRGGRRPGRGRGGRAQRGRGSQRGRRRGNNRRR